MTLDTDLQRSILCKCVLSSDGGFLALWTSASPVPSSAISSLHSFLPWWCVLVSCYTAHHLGNRLDQVFVNSAIQIVGQSSNNRSFQNDLSIPPAEGLRHCQPVGCYGIFWVPTGNSFSKGSGSRLFAYLTLSRFRNLLIQICKKAWGRD